MYQRELMQLSECLDSVETDLMKSRYCYSAQMMGKISGDIYSQCCTAKNALSSLPVDQPQLTGTYKFLSQTGDYARSLSKKDEITQKEYEDIETLLSYAQAPDPRPWRNEMWAREERRAKDREEAAGP